MRHHEREGGAKMSTKAIVAQGLFVNEQGWIVQWVHLAKGYTPEGREWVHQRAAKQPRHWHRLLPTFEIYYWDNALQAAKDRKSVV